MTFNLSECDVLDPLLTRLQQALRQIAGTHMRYRQNGRCPGSQEQEDEILRELVPLEMVGTYVDVGAYDPEETSNTWQYYKAGWRGLLIEPQPRAVFRLLHGRPGDYVWPVAAGNVPEESIGVMDISDACSSQDSTWDIEPTGRVQVYVDSLANILDKFPATIREQCRICSIDVEGSELAVLQGIDWETFRPDVFCIEHIRFCRDEVGPDVSDQWMHIFEAQNYFEVWRGTFNIILAREDVYHAWLNAHCTSSATGASSCICEY